MKKKLFLIAAMIIAMFSLGACSGIGAKMINLNDYVSVSFSGYEGYGTAEVMIDEEALEEACEKISVNESAVRKELAAEEDEVGMDLYDEEDIELILESMSAYDYILDILGDAELDKSENLSTGDEVTLSLKISEDDAEDLKTYFNASLKFEEITSTVEEGVLEEALSYDPFEDLTVTFTGMSGDGDLSAENTSEYSDYISYSADKTYGLSNDDVVTITATASDELADECGVILSATEKEYTVEGLYEYITSFSQISNESIEKMKSQAQDTMTAHVASEWADPDSYENMEYIGNYLLIAKSVNSTSWTSSKNNILYFVFLLSASDPDAGKISLYSVFSFSNVNVSEDGNTDIDLTECKMVTSGRTLCSEGTHGYYAYETLDDLYYDLIASNVDNYTYEDNIEE